jgi:hypothetical protein
MKVEILDGYQAFGGGGAKRMYGLETGEFSSMIFLMNSFGPHDGKIDPVFLPLPKKVVKQRMWLPKLERKSAGFWGWPLRVFGCFIGNSWPLSGVFDCPFTCEPFWNLLEVSFK